MAAATSQPLLGDPVFRMLWTVWLAANVCMWMNDAAAAWLMTTVSSDPVMVALVQSATLIPAFALALPSGALADIVDRRKWFIGTQFVVALAAGLLALSAWVDALTPTWLLGLLFIHGVGIAMRWPVFSAIVPEVVPRDQLASALALNSVAMNVSRVAGPVLAGVLIGVAGSAALFALNAVLSLVCVLLLWRWRYMPSVSVLPGERLLGAMRSGVRYAAQSRDVQVVLARAFAFFVHGMAAIALLPLAARQLSPGDPSVYTLLLSGMGAGAVGVGIALSHRRSSPHRERQLHYGTLLAAISTAALAVAPNAWVAGAAMVGVGAGWMTGSNALMVSAQHALPDWVRARGMSLYQMAVMAGGAVGAVVWGLVARAFDVPTALLVASALSAVVLVPLRRWPLASGEAEDLTPAPIAHDRLPRIDVELEEGPVLVTIEYEVEEKDVEAFVDLMQSSRRSRLGQGALSWGLFRDTDEPRRFVEHFIDSSWVEHLRRFDRATAADRRLRERRTAFHRGSVPPKVHRYVAQTPKRS